MMQEPRTMMNQSPTHMDQGSAAEPAPTETTTETELAGRLATAEEEIARLKDERLRALAEVENIRRRAARDREEAAQYAISRFARDLLAVADNLRRALQSVPAASPATDPQLTALVEGVEMTERELLSVLDRHGVKPVPALGEVFNPHVHEAMFELPDETVPHGTVVQVMQQGYAIHDRTLRPARVGLARGGPKVPPAAAADVTATTEAKPASADAYRRVDDTSTAGKQVDETH
jgi:molecular chaperone GrpE